MKKQLRVFKVGATAVIFLMIALIVFVKANPLIFNESFFGHAHCIKISGVALRIYGKDNGHWPSHTNGFGDAILSFDRVDWPMFTGPGFDSTELREAFEQGRDVDERKLGRIYVQGLTESANSSIAVLFDQNASPGDHVHGFSRLWAPAIREISDVGGAMRWIRDEDWHDFATNQIELLVEEGMDREMARSYYEMTGLKFNDEEWARREPRPTNESN